MSFDRQDFANRSLRGLAAQNWKQAKQLSTDGEVGNGCRYRADDGCGCAIGVLFGEHYDPSVEGWGLNSAYSPDDSPSEGRKALLTILDKVLPGWRDTLKDVFFLSAWQEIHDHAPDSESMKRAYRRHVAIMGLTWPEGI